MIALVTGANGFVGSHLVDLLLEAGHEVRCLVRRTSDLRWLVGKRVELHFGGILDPASLAEAVRGVRHVFHVAGVTKAARPADFSRVNGEGTRILAEACAEHARDLERLVYCSSLAAGGPAPTPRPISEETPPAPLGAYGRSKHDGEIALLRLSKNLPYCVVRPPAIYGPRDVAMLPVFRGVSRGFFVTVGRGERLISMVHVRDVARGLLLAARKGTPGRVYYVTDGAVHRWDEVGRSMGRSLGKRYRTVRLPTALLWTAASLFETVQRVGGPEGLLDREKVRRMIPRYWICDDGRARGELGYATGFPLEEGIRDTVAWYRRERWIR